MHLLRQLTLTNLLVEYPESNIPRINTETSRDAYLNVIYGVYPTLDGHKEKRVARVGDGSIITRFDKTPLPEEPTDVVCPHFLELKWATGCPYACAWCYLQGTFRFLDYKTKPRPKAFDRIEEHLTALFQGDGARAELLNSGELSDSLITETRQKPFSEFVMEIMERQDKHKVLFVTKSSDVSNFIPIKNKNQAVISFSINAKKVANRWEKAPKVIDRLEAARKLKNAGYEIRLRIDPMVPIDGWRKEYLELIDEIFERFTPDRITIGSLRGLQSTINNARDKSWTTYLDERSNWGKKISTETRKEMYISIIDKLKEDFDYRNIALCKETVQMWKALRMDYTRIKCNCVL